MNKELKEAIDFLELNACEGSNAKTILRMGDMEEVLKPIRKFLNEYFEPKPYEFEHLKIGMWFWDNSYKVFLKIIEIIEYGNTRELKVGDSHCEWYTKFEENRFYPISKVMEEFKNVK